MQDNKSLKEGEEKKAQISGEGMKDITFSEIDPRIKEAFPEPKEESTPDLTDRVNKYVPQYARQFFDVHIQELKNLREQNERLRR